jgi:SAM-dependent methyltransferase
MTRFSAEYWDEKYLQNATGWDVGYSSTPLKEYFDQLTNKELSILVPGAGKGHEVAYLFDHGFSNTYFLDFSEQSILDFTSRHPDFPTGQLLQDDFFNHQGQYDLIVEQTFFSAISPLLRPKYAKQCFDLLKPGGKLAGLLFAHEFDSNVPPFGGSENEYRELFSGLFSIEVLEIATNSIKPRKGRELFIKLRKNQL